MKVVLYTEIDMLVLKETDPKAIVPVSLNIRTNLGCSFYAEFRESDVSIHHSVAKKEEYKEMFDSLKYRDVKLSESNPFFCVMEKEGLLYSEKMKGFSPEIQRELETWIEDIKGLGYEMDFISKDHKIQDKWNFIWNNDSDTLRFINFTRTYRIPHTI